VSLPKPRVSVRLLARLVHGTVWIDRGFQLFDRARSRAIANVGSSRFFDAYNAVAYAAQPRYNIDAAGFRRDLFSWEADVFDRLFPPPPARVLVGAAGGGREVLALVERGYRVTAFEPVESLAKKMAERVSGQDVRILVGSYEQLPSLRQLDGTLVDLQREPPFDCTVMGWTSYSHLHGEERRCEVLRQLAGMTTGPVLFSYLPIADAAAGTPLRRPGFSVHIGWHQHFTATQVRKMVTDAGLELAADDGAWGYAVVRKPLTSPVLANNTAVNT
jgi:hypothetical protein